MVVIQFPDVLLTYRGYRHYTRIGAVTEQIRDDASLSVGMITAVDMQEFILILRAMNHPIVASLWLVPVPTSDCRRHGVLPSCSSY